MQTYVISLKSRRERGDASHEDLAKAISDLPGVEVIEDRGIRSITVKMPTNTALTAKKNISFATIEEYEELKLL